MSNSVKRACVTQTRLQASGMEFPLNNISYFSQLQSDEVEFTSVYVHVCGENMRFPFLFLL